jgi:hypothetical protein
LKIWRPSIPFGRRGRISFSQVTPVIACAITAKEAYSVEPVFRSLPMTDALKRSLLFFFFGDLLFSLLIFALVHWLKLEIMIFQKKIYFSDHNLLFVLWKFLKGFDTVLPAFV